MKNDELLSALADAAREDEGGEDPRWDALTRGALSEGEVAELTARAEVSEHARVALEAFSPLDRSAKDRITDRLLVEIAKGKPAARPEGARAKGPAPSSVRELRSSNAGPPSSRRSRVLFAVALAAAFGGVGLMGGGRGEAVALPVYALELEGGDRGERGSDAPDPIPHLGPGARLEITLRPSTRASGPVGARAFIVRDGRVRAWDVKLDVGASGAVRLVGVREQLFHGVSDGPLRLIFAVGGSDALPDAAAVEAALRDGGDPRGYRLLQRDVILGRVPGVTRDEGD